MVVLEETSVDGQGSKRGGKVVSRENEKSSGVQNVQSRAARMRSAKLAMTMVGRFRCRRIPGAPSIASRGGSQGAQARVWRHLQSSLSINKQEPIGIAGARAEHRREAENHLHLAPCRPPKLPFSPRPPIFDLLRRSLLETSSQRPDDGSASATRHYSSPPSIEYGSQIERTVTKYWTRGYRFGRLDRTSRNRGLLG